MFDWIRTVVDPLIQQKHSLRHSMNAQTQNELTHRHLITTNLSISTSEENQSRFSWTSLLESDFCSYFNLFNWSHFKMKNWMNEMNRFQWRMFSCEGCVRVTWWEWERHSRDMQSKKYCRILQNSLFDQMIGFLPSLIRSLHDFHWHQMEYCCVFRFPWMFNLLWNYPSWSIHRDIKFVPLLNCIDISFLCSDNLLIDRYKATM